MDLKISFRTPPFCDFLESHFALFLGGGGGRGPVSKEALDKQLDDYMSKGSA